jgi:hypothetical protein
MIDLDLLEQIGRHQCFQRGVERCGIVMAVGRRVELGTDGLGIDATIALDIDGFAGMTARGNNYHRCGEQCACDQRPAATLRRRHGFTHTSRLSLVWLAEIELPAQGKTMSAPR